MPELLLELFSEEIPARMQARGAEDFLQRLTDNLSIAKLPLKRPRVFHGPRRIGLIAEIDGSTEASTEELRGPRRGAPAQAINGFTQSKLVEPLSLDGATARCIEAAIAAGNSISGTAPQLDGGEVHWRVEWQSGAKGDFVFLHLARPARAAASVLADTLPYVIRSQPWPKSMRWGESTFMWVRPLQRILCLLDGDVVPFSLRHLDDAHGLASANLTEGHRVMAPGAFAVTSAADHAAKLRERRVILDAAERMRIIEDGLAALAVAHGVQVVPDRGLLEEVAGLVEWPVPLLGRIDDAFMDLPPELMRTTMRVNQRYFSVVTPDGSAAPFFGVVANIAATDGGAALVAGNERVLRARLSDARFFWDQDRKQKLEDFLPKLDQVVFHAKLGTQGQRVARLKRLARHIAPMVGADPNLAARAAQLAKADLASGMVGEFPELQGVMGRYYALHANEDSRVAEAIGAHYRPLGPGDAVPNEPVAIAVALADKLDTLTGFFAVGEKPTGSGDPYALRRAALGVIRIVRENGLRLPLRDVLSEAIRFLAEDAATNTEAPLTKARFQGRDQDTGYYDEADWQAIIAHAPRWLLDYDGYFGRLAERFVGLPLPEDFAEVVERDLRQARRLAASELEAHVPGLMRLRELPIREVRQAAQSVGDTKDDFWLEIAIDYANALDWLCHFAGARVLLELLDFLAERLRVQLRAEGARHDVVAAAFTTGEDDLVRLLARADALKALVESETGTNLLAAYKRAQNILRIEEKKDGPHAGPVDAGLLTAPEEQALAAALDAAEPATGAALAAEDYGAAMSALAALRAPLDAFFDRVTVNDPDAQLRRNRLRLLTRLRTGMDAVVDFSRIEG